MTTDFRIRRGVPSDGPEFLRLVHELAQYEKLDPPGPEAQARLLADAFAPVPKYELWVADEPDAEGTLAAYAIVVTTYSSFEARPTLYLEDIYVTSRRRGSGLARAFLRRLASEALDRGCARMEGIVLVWNAPARRFYAKTGATEKDDWVFFRYDHQALQDVAGTPESQRGAAKTPQNS